MYEVYMFDFGIAATAGMSVTFYDESPRLQHDFYEADTALEFGPADIPGLSHLNFRDLNFNVN